MAENDIRARALLHAARAVLVSDKRCFGGIVLCDVLKKYEDIIDAINHLERHIEYHTSPEALETLPAKDS